MEYWELNYKDTQTTPSFIIAKNKSEACNIFAHLFSYKTNDIIAKKIMLDQMVEKIGSDNMVKCMTQHDPKDFLERNAEKFKPNECQIYASECSSFECEDDYICQNCKMNRKMGSYLGTRHYRIAYIFSIKNNLFELNLIGC